MPSNFSNPTWAQRFFADDVESVGMFPSRPEGLVQVTDPLKLEIKEDVLVDTVDQHIANSRAFFKQLDYYNRRERNQMYFLGREIEQLERDGFFKEHETRYLDNVIYESESTLRSIALSRLPDLIVKPGNEGKVSQLNAELLTKWVNSQFKARNVQTALSMAYRHRPIYFIGAIKYRWDPEVEDYVFEYIHPENLDLDHLAPDNEIKHHNWIAHHYRLSAKDIQMRFPEKFNDFMEKVRDEIQNNATDAKKKDEPGMASTFKISEVWFTWYKKHPAEEEGGEPTWEKIEGVLWKYKNIILKKMRNPNWDWEGETKLFNFDQEGNKVETNEFELRDAMIEGREIQGLSEEKIFYNYLPTPEKPFILIGYDQLGMQPMDETTRIEQMILLQDNINKRGKQISEMADTAQGKNVFSTEGGLKSEDVEQIDMKDPDQDILVKGDINKVHRHISGQQPSAALFQEQEMSRNRAFAVAGANATTRGQRDARETATGRQILREADFAKQDDEVSATVNYAAEKMARAALQLIKLRYTKEKLHRVIGKDGSIVFESINRDLVEDGMEVEVTASAVDKLKRRQEAFEMAKLQLIDPLTFYEDTESSNPQERAERLMMFNASPEMYFENVVKGRNMQDMANVLNGEAPGEDNAAAQQAMQQAMADIATLQQGRTPTVPNPITPGYVATINDFINSPDFQQLPPDIQQNVIAYAQQLVDASENQEAQQPQQTPQQPNEAPRQRPSPQAQANPAQDNTVV